MDLVEIADKMTVRRTEEHHAHGLALPAELDGTKHLVIVFIDKVDNQRMRGAREKGLQMLDHTGRYSYEDGYSGMQAVLRDTPQVTAVFAMADVIAIGAIRALVDAGKRVPDDISIIGYDGLRIGSFYTPKLSTVSQSVELLARRSFSVLMDCTERGGQARHMTVPFTLSNRESVRKLENG